MAACAPCQVEAIKAAFLRGVKIEVHPRSQTNNDPVFAGSGVESEKVYKWLKQEVVPLKFTASWCENPCQCTA